MEQHVDISKYENFFIRFASDKVSMKMESDQNHYSVSFGLGSKVLDVHKTKENAPEHEKYEGHFYIRHFTIGRVLVYTQRVAPGFLQTIKSSVTTVTILKRLDLVLMPFHEDWALQFFKLDKNGTRMKPRKDVPVSVFDKMFLDCREVKKCKTVEIFFAIKEKRGAFIPYGLVIVFPNTNGSAKVIDRKSVV